MHLEILRKGNPTVKNTLGDVVRAVDQGDEDGGVFIQRQVVYRLCSRLLECRQQMLLP